MSFMIRAAVPEDREAAVSLLPRLADFDVPPERNPDHLWHGDRDLLNDWFDGKRNDVETLLAIDCNTDDETIVGVAVISYRKELLSHEPSAHLEILALDKSAEGRGIGQALLDAIEEVARDGGALSLSLHVFANNKRARALYERSGFSGELLRYYKSLDSGPAFDH